VGERLALEEQPIELRINLLLRGLLQRGRVSWLRLLRRRTLHGLLTLGISCQASFLHKFVHILKGLALIQIDRLHHLVLIIIVNRSWNVALNIVDRQSWVRIRVTRFLDETLDLRQLVQFSGATRADFGTS